MKRKSLAQGTIEYLVVIAIVVVISLLVVSLFSGIIGDNSDSVLKESKLYWQTRTPLAIDDFQVNQDSSWKLAVSNKSNEPLTLTRVEFDSRELYLNEQPTIPPMSDAVIYGVGAPNTGVNAGSIFSFNVKMDYVAVNNNLQKAVFGEKDLVGFYNSNNLAEDFITNSVTYWEDAEWAITSYDYDIYGNLSITLQNNSGEEKILVGVNAGGESYYLSPSEKPKQGTISFSGSNPQTIDVGESIVLFVEADDVEAAIVDDYYSIPIKILYKNSPSDQVRTFNGRNNLVGKFKGQANRSAYAYGAYRN